MKKILIRSLFLPVFLFFSFITADHNIVGHWITYTPDNSPVYVDFNSDGTFKVTVDGQIENQGNYRLSNDTFSMYDNNCGIQLAGKYKLNFYTEDSLSFSLIEDSCTERVGEVNGGVIKRIQ